MYTINYKYDNSLFSNIFGFLKLPLECNPYTTPSDWVITGIPFDMTTSGRPGSRFGPTAIRQASINLAWEKNRWPWNFSICKKLKIVDCGDLIYKFGDVFDFSCSLQSHSENLLMSKKKCYLLEEIIILHYQYYVLMQNILEKCQLYILMLM